MKVLKRCARCRLDKEESAFRYIKYFGKRRRICKQCESTERKGRRRAIEKHVQEHGVTPGILDRIQRETNEQAAKQARVLILTKLPLTTRITYYASKIILPLCYSLLFVFTLLTLIVLWTSMTKGAPGGSFDILVTFGVTVIITIILYKPVHSIDQQILVAHTSNRERLFREAMLMRIEYEKFYRSAEWRILN